MSGFDGVETQVTAVPQYESVMRSITANVALWPRPNVLVANPDAYRKLSAEQRGWLQTAIHDAIAPIIASQLHIGEELGILCRNAQFGFVRASAEQLTALHAAVQPAIKWLRRDADTADYLDRIAALRAGVTPYRNEQPSCAGISGSQADLGTRTPFDGTYGMVTPPDCNREQHSPENCGSWVFYFDRSHFAITQENGPACTWSYGTYAVTGDQVEWLFTDGGGIAPTDALNKPGEDFDYTWSVYKGLTTLAPVPGAISPFNFMLRPWHRLSAKPDASYLGARCPPPPEALLRGSPPVAPRTPFDGTYRVVNHDRCPDDCGTYVFVFDRGHFAITQESATVCNSSYGTYTVDGPTVRWTLSTGELYVWKWNLYKERLTLTPVSPADLPGYPPWQRLSTEPDPSHLSTRCPPPADALPS